LGQNDETSVIGAEEWAGRGLRRGRLLPSDGGLSAVGGTACGSASMAAPATDPKMDPADLVTTVLDALAVGEYEVLADETSVQLKAGLGAPIEALYPQLALSKS